MKKPTKNAKRQPHGKVKVTRNGPYLVTGAVPLSGQDIVVDDNGECHGWKQTDKYPAQEEYALCRCGHSRHKPFCDETHSDIGFNGTETASTAPYLEQADTFKGPNLTLTDARDLCASARFCDRGEGVWDLTSDSDSPEARKTAIEEACDCPSGRLVAWENDGKVIEPDFEPSIGLVHDTQAKKAGPIWVRGGIPIESSRGKIYEIRNRVTLCRCGKSSNKPFCDGSHMQ